MELNRLCDPCDRTYKSGFAVKYCYDCDEFYCPDCAVDHDKFKTLMYHHVVNVDITDEQSFMGKKKCPVHKDMILDFFCSDHDSICCKSCKGNTHRKCKNIKPLDVAAKGVIHSSMYTEFATNVVYLNNAVTQLINEWVKSKVAWDTSKDDVKRAVEKFKAKIFQRINEVEKRINEVEEKLSHEIESAKPVTTPDKSNADKQVEEIQDVLKQFNYVTKYGSERQIFRLIGTLKTNIPRMFSDMAILISSQTSSRLVFEESNILSMIESLGSITVKTSPLNIEFNPH